MRGLATSLLWIWVAAAPVALGDTTPPELGRWRIERSTLTLAQEDGLWVFTRLPTADQLELDAGFPPELRAALLAALERLRSADCERWLVIGDSDCGFVEALEITDRLTIDVGGLSSEPVEPAEPLILPILITAPTGSSLAMESLVVTVHAQRCRSGEVDPGTIATGEWGLEALRSRFALPPPGEPDRSVTLRVRCGEDQVPASEQARRALLEIAVEVYSLAHEQGFLPGAAAPAELKPAMLEKIQGQLALGDWSRPEIQVGHPETAARAWRIEIRNLPIIAAVAVEVLPGPRAGKVSETGQHKLEHYRRAAEQRIQKRYAPRSVLIGRVPTRNLVQQDEATLEAIEEVLELVDWGWREGTLIARLKRRTEGLDLGLTGRVSYSREKRLAAGAEISTARWTQELSELRLALKAEKGEQTRAVAIDLLWQTLDPRRRAHHTLALELDDHRDTRQLLGDPAAPFAESTTQGKVSWALVLDSWRRDRALECAFDRTRAGCRVHHFHDLTLAFEMRDVTLEPETLAGQVDRWLLKSEHTLGFDRRGARAGLGPIQLSLSLQAKTAGDYLGGDFRFDQYRLGVTGEVFWGWRSPRDLLLRHATVFGASSAATPLFEQFRLGGQGSVRGLEEGEAVGRGVLYDRSELGLLLEVLMADKVPENQLLAFLRGNAYLKIFYDRGGVADSSSFGELRRVRDDFTGYGAALELRELSLGRRRGHLSLGWARSAQSRRSSGSIFVELALGLGL